MDSAAAEKRVRPCRPLGRYAGREAGDAHYLERLGGRWGGGGLKMKEPAWLCGCVAAPR